MQLYQRVMTSAAAMLLLLVTMTTSKPSTIDIETVPDDGEQYGSDVGADNLLYEHNLMRRDVGGSDGDVMYIPSADKRGEVWDLRTLLRKLKEGVHIGGFHTVRYVQAEFPELERRLQEYEDRLARQRLQDMKKRKAFWQPMSGPLPVETRLASFGSRIEANHGSNKINPNILKAMRYGR